MAASPKKCLFCGQTDSPHTYEDVYPRWLRKSFGITDRGVTLHAGSGGHRLVRITRNLEVRYGGVCARCNNGWMSRLEGDFKVLMEYALTGADTVTIGRSDQDMVALWATKTALLLERSMLDVRGQGFAPTSHFRWLHDHRLPPATTRVWIGGVVDVTDSIAWGHTATVRNRAEVSEGYMAAFTIGHVLFQVIGIEDPATRPIGDAPINPPIREGKYLVPIWPNLLPHVVWPPDGVFGDINTLDSVWTSA